MNAYIYLYTEIHILKITHQTSLVSLLTCLICTTIVSLLIHLNLTAHSVTTLLSLAMINFLCKSTSQKGGTTTFPTLPPTLKFLSDVFPLILAVPQKCGPQEPTVSVVVPDDFKRLCTDRLTSYYKLRSYYESIHHLFHQIETQKTFL